MSDRTDFDPVFFAPFVSSAMGLERGWIDQGGHLNMDYYALLFGRAAGEVLDLLGLGPKGGATRGSTVFASELHVRHLRELRAETPVRGTVQLVDYDEACIHLFLQLHHAAEGWVAATCEQIMRHADTAGRRPRPFDDATLHRIAAMKAAHSPLPRPDGLGRSVGLGLDMALRS